MTNPSNIPDLKKFMHGLAVACHKEWPTVVLESDVSRIETCNNILLVLSRVLAGVAVRAGMPREEITKVVESSMPRAPKMTYASLEHAEVVVEHGVLDPWKVMASVDRCLINPKKAAKAHDWFKVVFYPMVVRDAALGEVPSTRDIEMMWYVVSLMEGER